MKYVNRVTLILALAATFSFLSCNKQFDQKAGLVQQDNSTALNLAAGKPNIVLIIGDDVGREMPTYNGGESYNTPNLDMMASGGMQFPYFFSHPDGPPSRIAMVTGRYNFRNWVELGVLADTERTFGNLLKNAGYATCFTGKWQFDGGDNGIKEHGFDKYRVFMPYDPKNPLGDGNGQFYHRYKNPNLYEYGHYMSAAEVNGQYSEDMFYDYASNFIDSNASKPFFLVYSFNLVQKPWVPTPDDAAFATWNPDTDDTNPAKYSRDYMPSMVNYLDKNIGKLINKVQAKGLMGNTIFLFVSDNATNKSITSMYKGHAVTGSKDSTTFNAINVPFVVYAPGIVAAGKTDTSLVDMTDFFPTFADIAGSSTSSWLPLDGKSFYDNMLGTPVKSKQRSYVYCYWYRDYQQKPNVSYILDYTYKLYDSINGSLFYNYKVDPYELSPLKNRQLTPDEKKLKNKYSKLLVQIPQS